MKETSAKATSEISGIKKKIKIGKINRSLPSDSELE